MSEYQEYNSYSSQWRQDNANTQTGWVEKFIYYPATYLPKIFHFLYRGLWDFVWRWLR